MIKSIFRVIAVSLGALLVGACTHPSGPLSVPSSAPLVSSTSVLISPTASPRVVEEAEIPSANGTVWVQIHRPADQSPRPVLIYSHGMGDAYTSGEPLAAALVEQGYVVYIFDFIGGSTRSRSGGDTAAMTVFSEVADLQAVADHAAGQEFVDSRRIYFFGVSHGGLVAALAASERDDVLGVVLVCPAFGIDEAIRERYLSAADLPESYSILNMDLGRGYFEALYEVELLALAAQYRGPVLILHGTEDTIIPVAKSEEATAAFPDARLITLEGEGHILSGQGRKQVFDDAQVFFESLG